MRRNRLEIIQSILDIARKGATKTQIVYRANLNFKLANDLLARLLRAGYVTLERPLKGRPRFKTTLKGSSFQEEIERILGVASELDHEREAIAEGITIS